MASPRWKLVLATAVLAAPILITADASATTESADWRQYGFDTGHSWYNPEESAITSANVAHLHLVWRKSLRYSLGELSVAHGKEFTHRRVCGGAAWAQATRCSGRPRPARSVRRLSSTVGGCSTSTEPDTS